MISRRSFFTGLATSLAAPAIVHAGNLMPISGKKLVMLPLDWYVEHRVISPDTYAELVRISRAAFVPRLFVQVYSGTPLSALPKTFWEDDA